MGMDLIATRKNAEDLHYNWSGWRWLSERLPVNLAGSNDGERLTVAECRKVAAWIEAHQDEYNAAFGGEPEPLGYGEKPALAHAETWRKSGGFRQW